MISFDEALSEVLAHSAPLPAVTAGLEDALGCALAGDVCAPHDLPGFDNSAVDGFGLRLHDVQGADSQSPARLPVARTVRAGDDVSEYALPDGSAIKILTGAAVPRGVEAVVMKEYTRELVGEVEVLRPAARGDNIRRRGEEFRLGDVVLEAGVRVTPPVVGLLATVGRQTVAVHRPPRVQVLVTGDELVAPGRSLAPGQIYESNSFALLAHLRNMGISQARAAHLTDDREIMSAGLREAVADADVVLTVGGVSVGDYDYVKEVLEDLGVRRVYWRINMKPGKPNYFGVQDRPDGSSTLVFGLPGNPVSVQVSFHQLVRPALLKLMGCRAVERRLLTATLETDLPRAPGRREFVRGQLSTREGRLIVTPCRGQGSHMQGGLARADCLIDLPTEQANLQPGAQVSVELLSWFGPTEPRP